MEIFSSVLYLVEDVRKSLVLQITRKIISYTIRYDTVDLRVLKS